MKLLLVSLALLCGQALAGRELKQLPVLGLTLGLGVEVCKLEIYEACCANYDFGPIEEGPHGPYPTNTTCTIRVKEAVPVGIVPREAPLSKEDAHDIEALQKYATATYTESSVNLVSVSEYELSKYDPPNNVWTADGYFCICPTSPPAPVAAAVTGGGPSGPNNAAATNAAVNAAQAAAANARATANVGK